MRNTLNIKLNKRFNLVSLGILKIKVEQNEKSYI